MHKTDGALQGLDLRSLRLLAVVLELRNVTRAAESLGMSQPAASRALSHLRRALGDKLLVRVSTGAALTPRAEALVPLLAAALAAVDRLFTPSVFAPAVSRGVVRVATSDYGAAVVLAALAPLVARAAPKLRLDALPWGAETLAALEAGHLDLALYADGELPGDFHTRDLFSESYACLVRQGHPVLAQRGADGQVAVQDLAALPRAIMLYPDGREVQADDVLTQSFGAAAAESIVLRTPYFLSAPLVVAQSDMILCLPRRAAQLMARLGGIVVLDLPEEVRFTYRLIWHERSHSDPMLRWVRARICDSV